MSRGGGSLNDVQRVLLGAVLAFGAVLPAAAQCSMCKESLKEEEAAPLASGFRVTIYGMILVPFALAGAIVFAIVRGERKAAAARAAAAPRQPTV